MMNKGRVLEFNGCPVLIIDTYSGGRSKAGGRLIDRHLCFNCANHKNMLCVMNDDATRRHVQCNFAVYAQGRDGSARFAVFPTSYSALRCH